MWLEKRQFYYTCNSPSLPGRLTFFVLMMLQHCPTEVSRWRGFRRSVHQLEGWAYEPHEPRHAFAVSLTGMQPGIWIL